MKKTLGRDYANRGLPWIIPILLALLWIGLTEKGGVPGYLLPSPGQVLGTAFSYIFGTPGQGPYAGRFLGDFYASLTRVLIGFGLAVLAGLPLGVLSGRVTRINRLLGMSVNGLRAVPGISLLPLALVWFGTGLKTTVFLVSLAAFFPIFLNVETGVRQVHPTLLQAGAMLGVGRLRGIFKVLLPAAMPQIITGLRLGMGVSWAYLVLGELTGVPDGLGALIMDARMAGRTDIIIVGILLIALIGRLCDACLYSTLRLCLKSARRLP